MISPGYLRQQQWRMQPGEKMVSGSANITHGIVKEKNAIVQNCKDIKPLKLMIKGLRASKKIVEETLRDYPETRSSDKKLFLKVLERFGLTLTDEQKRKFLQIPISYESVRRNRQRIQNEEGKYLPDEKTLKARRWERDAMKHAVLSEEEKWRRFSEMCL